MRLSSRSSAGVMLAGMALAVWPVWRWYVLRMSDGSDEPFGLLALATLVLVAMRNGVGLPNEEKRFIAPAILLAVYAVTFHLVLPLPRAILAVAAFALLLFRRETLVASGSLLLLSLPLLASVQFYAGYPLRVIAAETSVIGLRALGFAVVREGSLLHWRGETIMVDAPCSGVRMLWCGLYLAATLAAYARLGNARSAFVIATAVIVVIAANALRATLLFFKEAGIVALPHWTHAGLGLLLFATAALLITRIRGYRPCYA